MVNFVLFTIILHFLLQITNLGAKFFGIGHHQLSVLSLMTDYDDKVIDDVDDVTNKLNEFDSLLFIGEK